MAPKHVLTILLALPLSLRIAACRDFDGDSAEVGSNAGGLGGMPSDHAGGTPMDDTGGVPPLAVGGKPSSGGQAGATGGGGASTTGGSRDGGAAGLFGDGGAGGVGSSGNDGEAGASPDLSELSPSEFPNLVWWLEASRTLCTNDAGEAPDGDFRVAQCIDGSGHDNTAKALDLTREPLFVADGPSARPTLKFDGDPSLLTVADSQTLHFGFDAFTLLLVGRWSNSVDSEYENGNDVATYPGCGAVLSKVAATFPFAGFALFVNYPGIFAGRPTIPRLAVQLEYASSLFMSYSTNLNDNKLRLYVVSRPRAGVGQIRINGHDDGSSQIPAELDVSAQGQPLMIGGWVGTPFRGDLSEVVALAGTVEQPEFERLERHLMHKYALLP